MKKIVAILALMMLLFSMTAMAADDDSYLSFVNDPTITMKQITITDHGHKAGVSHSNMAVEEYHHNTLTQNPGIFHFRQWMLYLNIISAEKEIQKIPYSTEDFSKTGCISSDLVEWGLATKEWTGREQFVNLGDNTYIKVYSMRSTDGPGASQASYSTWNGPKTLGPVDGSKGPNAFTDTCPSGSVCKWLISIWSPCNLGGTAPDFPSDGDTEPVEPDIPDVVNKAEQRCKGASVWWYDSNGNPYDFIEFCEYGCEDAACNPKPETGGGETSQEEECPEGTYWNGKVCVQTPVTCPEGTTWNGQECVPIQVPGEELPIVAYIGIGLFIFMFFVIAWLISRRGKK